VAEKDLADILIKRRDKIKSIYLTAVNPIVSARLDANGRLTFDNAAVAAGVATGPATYHATWSLFDNTTGETRPLSETQSPTTTIEAPRDLPTAAGSFVKVEIRADAKEHPSWKKPVSAYFRRANQGWQLAGFERMP
jgi:hypothetical protein